MEYPRVIVDAKEERDKYIERVEQARRINAPLPHRPVHVEFHGRIFELLGKWKDIGYEYAAIRIPGERGYSLIHPRYLKRVNE